jgi:hypothetical protein
MIITNENWIKLGSKFCKLKIDFYRRYKNKQKENNEKFILYNYDYSYIFYFLAKNFNNIIKLYFNNNEDNILYNKIHVSDIFYNMVEFNFYDCYKNNVKGIDQLLYDTEKFITLVDKYLIDYKETIYYINIKKVLKLIINKISNNYL